MSRRTKIVIAVLVVLALAVIGAVMWRDAAAVGGWAVMWRDAADKVAVMWRDALPVAWLA